MATIELKSAGSINWSALLDQVRIDYETAPAKGLAHGLQKEAIQNGWGARRNERGTGWGFAFKLTPDIGGHRFLTMTDRGTFGLTGDLNFDVASLPENAPIPTEQRWARFEGVYESGGDGMGPGSFGRGKFIFNLASKERIIYYDSLTNQGEYRLGMRRIKGRDYQQLKYVLTGSDAEKHLEGVTGGQLARLEAPGTRIIVVDPIVEVVESIENGDFLRAIGETWWEIIQKYSAEITIQVLPKAEAKAAIPEDFGGFPDRSVKGWKVYRRDNVPLVIDGVHSRIKRLHFLVAPTSRPIRPDLRGVVIHRRGMAVGPVKLSGIPDEIEERFFGYVLLEPELEDALIAANQEGTTHYGFVLPRRLPYRHLQQVIQNDLDEFLDSMGLKPAANPEERLRKLADEAQSELNTILNSLGVPGFGTGKSQEDSLLVSVEDLAFPRDSNQLSRGDSVTGFRFRIDNVSRQDQTVWWRVYTHDRDVGVVETLMKRNECRLAVGKNAVTARLDIKLDVRYPTPSKVGCVCELSDSSGKVITKKTFYMYLDLPPAPEQELAKIHLRMASWPRSTSRRVDYDESITSLLYEIENRDSHPMKLRLRLRTLWANESNTEIAEVGSGWQMDLGPYQAKALTVPEIQIGRAEYQEVGRGKINLRMHAVALEASADWAKGDRLAEHTIAFFLNMDPNFGFFDDPEFNKDGKDAPRSRARPIEGAKTWRLSINVLHPAYLNIEGDADLQKDYLFEEMARQTVYVLLRTGHGDTLAKQAGLAKDEDVFEMNAPDLVQRVEFAVTDKIVAQYYGG